MSDSTPKTLPLTSWYVPPKAGSTAKHEAYVRFGGPDVATEIALHTALAAAEADRAGEEAVRRSFNTHLSGGLAAFTAGDQLQLIGGKSDTRVLAASHTVHVLHGDGKKGESARSYLRMGNPNLEVEQALYNPVNPDKLEGWIDETGVRVDANLGAADFGAAGQSKASGGEATANAREKVRELALAFDDATIDGLEDLRRTGADAEVKTWAADLLHAALLAACYLLRDAAVVAGSAARATLAKLAKDDAAPAILVLVELTEERGADAEETRTWAEGVLSSLEGKDHPRFSDGDGVSLYSDKTIHVTSPDVVTITSGAFQQHTFGETRIQVASVPAKAKTEIKSGSSSTVESVTPKQIVTSIVSRPDASGAAWRTTKFDLAKTLNVTGGDNGSMALGSDYKFSAGLKAANFLGVGFDASVGVDIKTGFGLKCEINDKGIETTSPIGGKVAYKSSQSMKGSSIEIAVDAGATVMVSMMPVAGKLIRGSMIALNAFVGLYTTTFVAGGLHGDRAFVDGMMDGAEAAYATALALNTVSAALCLSLGIAQLILEKSAKAAAAAPAATPGITVNAGGIALRAGTTFLHVTPAGVIVSGAQLVMAAPTINNIAFPLPANISPPILLKMAPFLD